MRGTTPTIVIRVCDPSPAAAGEGSEPSYLLDDDTDTGAAPTGAHVAARTRRTK